MSSVTLSDVGSAALAVALPVSFLNPPVCFLPGLAPTNSIVVLSSVSAKVVSPAKAMDVKQMHAKVRVDRANSRILESSKKELWRYISPQQYGDRCADRFIHWPEPSGK